MNAASGAKMLADIAKVTLGREKAIKLAFMKLGIGKIQKLIIDTKRKQIYCAVYLNGEQEPIVINVGKYSLSSTEQTRLLILNDVKISKEWIKILVDNYLEKVNNTILIPPKFAGYVSILE